MASSATRLTLAGSQFSVDEKLGEYLRALEEERTKVEAFKRELPLCLRLVDEAIESAKQRAMEDQCSPTTSLQTSERSKGTPVLENFMPLKRRWENPPKESKSGHGSDHECEQHHELVLGRPAWSGEAQLWTQQSPDQHEKAPRGTKRSVEFGEAATDTMASSRLHLSSKHRQGGAFVPFIRERHSPESAAASPAGISPVNAKPTSEARLADVGAYDRGDARMMASQGQAKAHSQRKTRRCWSPELHRRFVSALQQLGGSQVATPKQIRELMKVDSLTNDEVKSHLQKYRLHTRRPSPSPSSSNASAQAPQLVVLGWMRPDQFQAAVGAAASQASAGGGVVCDGPPPLVVAHKYAPPEQPPMDQPTAPSPKHLPAVSTSHSSLPGRSSVTGGSPNSSSDSDTEEADHDVRKVEEPPQLQLLQPARESKGSTTSLVDIGSNTHTSRKTGLKAAA